MTAGDRDIRAAIKAKITTGIRAMAVGFLQRARAIDTFEIALLIFVALEVVARVHFNVPTGFFAALAVVLTVLQWLKPSLAALRRC